MRTHLFLILFILFTSFHLLLSEERDDVKEKQSIFKARREAVKAEIGSNAVAFFITSPVRRRNGDVDFQYRQESNFYYLTGMNEEDAVLVLVPKGLSLKNIENDSNTVNVTEVLFLRQRNKMFEQWTGKQLGTEGAVNELGVQYALPNDRLKLLLDSILSGINKIYLAPLKDEYSGFFSIALKPLRDLYAKKGIDTALKFNDPTAIVKKLRIKKSPVEISLIERATQISALAHNQAMMSCQPGMFEYELAAVYEYVFKKSGSPYPAYPSIVGAGKNALIYHYSENNKKIENGDMIVADCGAEFQNYASDITRSFPAGGKFTQAQKRVYEIVINVNKAAIAMLKPGIMFTQISKLADSLLEEGIYNLGLIKEKNKRDFRKFYGHGLGHPVGLDVNDGFNMLLEPGVVLTIEPGIYIPDGAEGVSKDYYNLGVRIEDTILITEDGCRILSKDAVKEIADIEKLMKLKGIGKIPLK